MIKESYNLVYGVGVKGMKYPAKKDKKHLIEYKVWASMLMRCYSKSAVVRKPCYEDCTVSDNFKSYVYFYEWCNNQAGFNEKDENGRVWQLDKDFLIKGNKVYSEHTSIFIPKEINTLLLSRQRDRSVTGIGNYYKDGRFIVQCSVMGRQTRVGCFKTQEEAFSAYKIFKENRIKEVAEKWKGIVDDRVYQALINYEVNIND